jgi:hypothetical protein
MAVMNHCGMWQINGKIVNDFIKNFSFARMRENMENAQTCMRQCYGGHFTAPLTIAAKSNI